jgi:hypothetical protein
MTQVTHEPRTAAPTRADVERLLRDLAFALRLGRRAAREIRADRPGPSRPVAADTGRPVCAAA